MNDDILLTPTDIADFYEDFWKKHSPNKSGDAEAEYARELCRAQVRKVVEQLNKQNEAVEDVLGLLGEAEYWTGVCIDPDDWLIGPDTIQALKAAGEGEDAPPTPISYSAQTELGKRLVDIRNKAAGIDAALKRCVADKELSPAHEIAAETSRAQTEHLAEVLERVCFHKCPHAQSDACVGKACADCWQEYLVQALREAAGGEG